MGLLSGGAEHVGLSGMGKKKRACWIGVDVCTMECHSLETRHTEVSRVAWSHSRNIFSISSVMPKTRQAAKHRREGVDDDELTEAAMDLRERFFGC